MSTLNDILLYGAEMWVRQWGLIITASARSAVLWTDFRLVVIVVARIITLDLLAVERQNIFCPAAELERSEFATLERKPCELCSADGMRKTMVSEPIIVSGNCCLG